MDTVTAMNKRLLIAVEPPRLATNLLSCVGMCAALSDGCLIRSPYEIFKSSHALRHLGFLIQYSLSSHLHMYDCDDASSGDRYYF